MTSKKNSIKGYKGSGTQTDPILISNFQEIEGLERADVGQKGYYFRQTADIDCSSLTTWPAIVFQGHYDGGGYTVSYNNQQKSLFSHIKPQSTITRLRVRNLLLATNAFHCEISACTSVESSFIQEAENCNITACITEQHLIADNANECVITRCQSGWSLIGDTARACKISNCLSELAFIVPLPHCNDNAVCVGGVAVTFQGCIVECCFVTGEISEDRKYISGRNGYCYFSGVAETSDASSIRFCSVGKIQLSEHIRWNCRIVNQIKDASKLQDNIALDSHQGQSDAQGKDGKSVSAASFTQHYFENHLGWDFDTVWQWNSNLNRPQLQSVGVGATVTPIAVSTAKTDDLLTQQISANIWL